MLKQGVLTFFSAITALALYRFAPTFPKGLEGFTFSDKVQNVVARGIFKALLAFEGYGLIEDSAPSVRRMANAAFPDVTIEISQQSEVSVESTTIAGVPVLIIRPQGTNPRGALVYFHGGGFVLFNPMTHFLWSKLLAKEGDAIVVSVDYRLAPEHPYPAGIDDCLKVTKTVFDEAEKYGIDSSRIMVGGESAGGNFASIVAIELASSDKYRLKGQLLITPALQALEVLPSAKAYAWLFPFPKGWMVAKYVGASYWNEINSAYLAGQHLMPGDKNRFTKFLNISNLSMDIRPLRQSQDSNISSVTPLISRDLSPDAKDVLSRIKEIVLNERAWPLLTLDDEKLKQMCPTFLSVAEFDPLRDEGLLYYDRLRALGTKVTLSYMPGAAHAEPVASVVLNRTLTERTRTRYIPDIISFVKTCLHPDSYN